MWWKKKENKTASVRDLNESVKLLADVAMNADPPEYAIAFSHYKLAAEEGNDADAQYNLAYLYVTGQGTEKNYLLAARWKIFAEISGRITFESDTDISKIL